MRSSAGPSAMTGDAKISAQTATHDDGVGGTWYLADGSAIPAGETGLIALLGANFPDARGRALVMLGTHADVNTIGDNDGVTLASRRPKHNTTVLTNPSFSGQASSTGNDSPDHSHAVNGNTGNMNSAQSHSHGPHPDLSDFWGGQGGGVGIAGGSTFTINSRGETGYANIDHSHPVNIQSGGRSAFHSHGFTPAGSISGGAYGPGGTAAADQPAYVVPGNLFYHS